MSPPQTHTGFAEENFSWQQYSDTRPPYPDSFFDLVYQFHRGREDREPSWKLAADVGAGHGVVAAELSRRFRRVAVLEPNAEYLDVARRRLSQLHGATFSFHQAGAEEEVLPKESADLVILGMSIQWTDHRDSVSTAAYHLAAAGTLAIIFYRRPYISNNATAAEVWDDIWVDAVKVMLKTGQMEDPTTKRAWQLENSGLDCVAIPCPPFNTNTTRMRLNADGETPFVASAAYTEAAHSAVGPNDKIERRENLDDWTIRGVSAAWLLQCLHSYLAGVQLFTEMEMNAYRARLEAALEESDGVADATHPVSIILARKQGQE